MVQGDRVELTCEATGEPVPRVGWSQGNWTGVQELPGRVTVQLVAARPSDSGTYSCTAVSEAGSDEEQLQLVVTPRDDRRPPLRTLPEGETASLDQSVIGDRIDRSSIGVRGIRVIVSQSLAAPWPRRQNAGHMRYAAMAWVPVTLVLDI